MPLLTVDHLNRSLVIGECNHTSSGSRQKEEIRQCTYCVNGKTQSSNYRSRLEEVPLLTVDILNRSSAF